MQRILTYILLLIGSTTATRSTAQDIVINEIMAANLGEVIDGSWNFGGWLELYNPTERSCPLQGLTLADNKGHRFTLTKDHGDIEPKGYKCLWFGHNSTDFPLQADFNLDCAGGTISITGANGTIATAIYPKAIGRTSWARTTDASNDWQHCATPTPAATNDGASYATQQLPPPIIDHNGGWIEGSQDFTVSLDPEACLHYTTDGTAPTIDSPGMRPDATGHVHFSVATSTVYRFRAYDHSGAHLPSSIDTRSFIERNYSYFAPGGWEVDHWGDWIWVDGQKENIRFDGFSLFSLTTDPRYLYDNTIGIYVKGTNGGWSYWSNANFYRDWDRPVNVEIFTPEDLPLINQEVDMTMAGGYGRMYDPKSFKIKCNKKYGDNNFFTATDIFPEKPYARYKQLLVRAGGSNLTDRHQDNALQALVRRSGFYVDSQAYRPVFVFFNGQYQELLMLREPSNKHFGYSNYGMDTDEMDTFEESDILGMTLASGTWDAFDELYDAAKKASKSDTSWERVKELLDIDEYANYFALETYLANQDWPQNNIKMFRDQNDGRFHVVLQDLDACFHETSNTFERMENNMSYYYAMVGYEENRLLCLFLNLMKREEFRKRFVDAFTLVAGSVLHPSVAAEELDNMCDMLSAGYDSKLSELHSVFATLKSNLSEEWREKRLNYLQRWSRSGTAAAGSISASIKTNSRTARLTLNGQPIPRSEFEGMLFLPVTLKAHATAGKTFVGWTRNGNIVSSEETIRLTQGGNYEARFIDDTSEADNCAPIVINEVCAAGEIYQSERLKRSDWIELYNTTSQPIDISGMYLSDDTTQPLKCRITTADSNPIIVAPYSYCVVWADDVEPATAENGSLTMPHLNFKLANKDHSAIVLSNTEGETYDTFYYHAHSSQQSVGRWPDGGKDVYRLDHPTIEASNVPTSRDEQLKFDSLIVGTREALADEPKSAPRYDIWGRAASTATSPMPYISISKSNKTIVRTARDTQCGSR